MIHQSLKGMTIHQLFEQSGRAMLILGAPGSGKTFTLLELCRDLLFQAEQHPDNPIPVILNLSTWAEKEAPLTDWIVEQMVDEYQLSRPVTREWLQHNHLCLLLDGLDEVREEVRNDCVIAINNFRRTHQVPLVVLQSNQRLQHSQNASQSNCCSCNSAP